MEPVNGIDRGDGAPCECQKKCATTAVNMNDVRLHRPQNFLETEGNTGIQSTQEKVEPGARDADLPSFSEKVRVALGYEIERNAIFEPLQNLKYMVSPSPKISGRNDFKHPHFIMR
jgi:hypothetical protein